MSINNYNDEILEEIYTFSSCVSSTNTGILKIVPSTYENIDAIEKTITYVASHAIPNGCNGVGCSYEPATAISDFYRVKDVFNKSDGRQVKHIIAAFMPSPEVSENIYTIAWNIGFFFGFRGYQCFYGIHESIINNKIAYHIHFIVNTVNFHDGIRFTWSHDDKRTFLQYIESQFSSMKMQSINSFL